jgi:5-(aminomethyl)-3-furanmethanol phosphate kinase
MSKYSDSSLPSKPLVVKLGGSLFSRVPELVQVFQKSPRPLFIVPGGGKFADAVREARLPDDEAHWMAIGAMDQYGIYVSSFGLTTTDLLEIPEKTTVFLPFRSTKHYDPLPHSWDITSDTIAAWIAGKLSLELLILKSVDGICANGKLADIISESIETDVVDPCCISYIMKHGIRTTIVNGSNPEAVIRFLRGDTISCTRIGTTF